jgi:hypothetical protein
MKLKIVNPKLNEAYTDAEVSFEGGSSCVIENGLLTAKGPGIVTIETYFGTATMRDGHTYIVDIPTYNAYKASQAQLTESVNELTTEAEKDPCKDRGHAWVEDGHDSHYDWFKCNRCKKRIKENA